MPSLYRDLLFHAFDQYLRNFRTRKFRRRALPLAKQAANLRTRQGQMVLLRMRASFAGGHVSARCAEEAVLEEQRGNA